MVTLFKNTFNFKLYNKLIMEVLEIIFNTFETLERIYQSYTKMNFYSRGQHKLVKNLLFSIIIDMYFKYGLC